MFGGRRKVGGPAIAETTLLHLGEWSVSYTSMNKLNTLPHNNCRISTYRIYLNKTNLQVRVTCTFSSIFIPLH